ncbi:hypothetical protein PR202_gb13075 [Eleusine coracana subsp. coracana]|uniref:Uncharacterized protein n=1 Tax=Eleusine coracana subsp. coracana TaxID=191504 RepID=A0AAV5ES34_ELECO|nr:hypothetical protein PR202_gb13075 [Eleusine coracana subsp. coracana]
MEPVRSRRCRPPSPRLRPASALLADMKLPLRCCTTAMAAMDAGLPAEFVRHFSKILNAGGERSGRRRRGWSVGARAEGRTSGGGR